MKQTTINPKYLLTCQTIAWCFGRKSLKSLTSKAFNTWLKKNKKKKRNSKSFEEFRFVWEKVTVNPSRNFDLYGKN